MAGKKLTKKVEVGANELGVPSEEGGDPAGPIREHAARDLDQGLSLLDSNEELLRPLFPHLLCFFDPPRAVTGDEAEADEAAASDVDRQDPILRVLTMLRRQSRPESHRASAVLADGSVDERFLLPF